MAKVIEASNNRKMHTILTIRTDRGDEYVINADKLARGFADFLSDQENEKRNGWRLHISWYKTEFEKLVEKALVS